MMMGYPNHRCIPRSVFEEWRDSEGVWVSRMAQAWVGSFLDREGGCLKVALVEIPEE